MMAQQVQEGHRYMVSLPCTTLLGSKGQFMPLHPPKYVAAAGWQEWAGCRTAWASAPLSHIPPPAGKITRFKRSFKINTDFKQTSPKCTLIVTISHPTNMLHVKCLPQGRNVCRSSLGTLKNWRRDFQQNVLGTCKSVWLLRVCAVWLKKQ